MFNNIDVLALDAINKVKNIKLEEIFEQTNIDTIEGLYNLIQEDIIQTLNNINDNYNNNIENINKFINTYVYENITSKVLEQKLENILDVDENISVIVKSMLEQINSNSRSRDLLLESIKKAYNNNIIGMKLNDILDQDVLISEIEIYLEKIFKDIDFNENNQYIVDKIIFNCIESALLTTGIGFTVDTMKALKLKEITTEQVEIMDPREIHMLFNAFAGDFFIKLYLYGSMGAVFGLNMYLSIVLWIADWFYSKKVDEFEINTDNIFKE